MNEKKCPKCGSMMSDDGVTISSNSKFKNWRCEVCNHKEIVCMGLVKQYGL